jgi:uncharacterized membrane protein
MDKTRFETFSDGVFAVAITLLALNLGVKGPGHGSLAHQLGDHWPSFAAYVVSFFTIGIVAVTHHALFKTVAAVDRVLVFINLALLLFVVLIPFATATMATYLRAGGADAHLAAAIYALALEGMGLGFFAIFWWSLHRQLLIVPLTPRERRTAIVRFGIVGNAAYIFAIGIAFLSAPMTLAICGLVALYYVFEQTPSA